MSETIVSRQTIALQAERAARNCVAAGQGIDMPPNPYCAHYEPEHHLEWAVCFKRALHALTAPEGCEGSA